MPWNYLFFIQVTTNKKLPSGFKINGKMIPKILGIQVVRMIFLYVCGNHLLNAAGIKHKFMWCRKVIILVNWYKINTILQ